MKTDELIRVLAADAASPSMGGRRSRAAGFLAVGGLVAVALFALMLGLRPDFVGASGTWRFPVKVLVMALLLATAAMACSRLRGPVARPADAFPVLLVAPAALALAVAVEMSALPSAAWRTEMLGSNSLFCMIAVPALAAAPLVALLSVLRDDAPASPTGAGAVAGLVSGAFGGFLYALHCPDDSPLFVAVWYSIGILASVALGALAGRRLLRW